MIPMDLSTITPLNKEGSADPVFKMKLDVSSLAPIATKFSHLSDSLSDINFVHEVQKAKDLKPDVMQIPKGVGSAAVGLTVGTVGDTLAFAGRNIDVAEKQKADAILKKRSQPDYNWMMDYAWLTDSRDLMYQKMKKDGKGLITVAGDKISEFSKGVVDKFLARKPGLANQLMYDVSAVGGSVAASFGIIGGLRAIQAARVLQTASPAAWFGAQAAGQVAATGETKGASQDAQNKAYLESFVGNFSTELVGGELFLNTLRGTKIAERIAINTASNFSQEGLQTLSDELAMKLNSFNDNDWNTITKNVAYSAALGAVAGGVTSGVHAVAEQRSIIGELRGFGLSDQMIETSFNELNALPDVVNQGDLTKNLIAKGFDEVSAQAVENKFADIGYKQWMGEGLGETVKLLQQKGLNASEAFSVAEILINDANKHSAKAINEHIMQEMEKIGKASEYQKAYEFFAEQIYKAGPRQGVSADELDNLIVSEATTQANIAVSVAEKQGVSVDEVLNLVIQGGGAVNVGAEQNDINAQVLNQTAHGEQYTVKMDNGINREGKYIKTLKSGKMTFVDKAGEFFSAYPGQATKNGAESVISYVKDGKKFYTKISQSEYDSLFNEVKNIPTPNNGESQIHLDAITNNLIKGGQELSRADFIKGHSQAGQLLDKVLNQGSSDPRGQINLTSKEHILKLFKTADASTLTHEMAHHWLKIISDFANSGDADSKYLQWYGQIKGFLNLEDGKPLTVEQQEKFARAFEQYLRTGESPTENLKPVFESFKRWLSSVYKTAQALDVELTPEAKSFFDTLVTVDNTVEGEEVDDSDTSWQTIKASLKDVTFTDDENEIILRGENSQDELNVKNDIRRYLYRRVSSKEMTTGEMQDVSKKLLWMFKKDGMGFDDMATEFFGMFPDIVSTDNQNLSDQLRAVIVDMFVKNSDQDARYRANIKEARVLVNAKLKEKRAQIKKEAKDISKANAALDVSEYIPTLQEIEDNATDTVRRSVSAARRLGSSIKVKAKLDDVKAKYMDIIEQLRWKINDIQRVKKDISQYATKLLPKGYREKAIPFITNAKNQGDLIKAFVRINEWADNASRSAVLTDVKKLIDQIAKSESIDLGYKQKAEAELDKFDLEGHSKRTIERVKKMKEWADAHPGNAKITPDMAEQLDWLSKTNIRDLTEAQLLGLKHKLDLIYKIGQTKQRLKENVRKIIKQQMLDELRISTVAINSKDQIIDPGNKLSAISHLKNTISDYENSYRKMNLALTFMDTYFDNLDGGKGTFEGANYKIFKAVTDYNFGRYLDLKDRYQVDVLALAKELKLNQQDFERIGMYAALAQEGGYDKLKASLTPEKLEEAVNTKLTDNQMKWYEVARAKLDEVRPSIEKMMKDEFNRPLGEVKNYFPFITNWEALDETDIQDRFGAYAEQAIGEVMKKNPNMKFTIERKGGKIAIELNAMNIYLKHTDNVAYFLSMTKDNRLLYEIAKSKDYKAIAGDIGAATTLNYIDTIARKGGTEISKRISWLDALRRNIGVGTLGFKLSTIALQPTALIDTAGLIGDYAFKGAVNITNDQWAELVLQFPEVRRRAGDDPAYAEFLNDTSNKSFLWLRKIQEVGMKPIQKTDMWAAMSAAAGAYEKYMNEHKLEINFAKPNKEAMNYAQRVVRLTQSSGFFKDAPQAATRGSFSSNLSVDKALLQFNNFALRRFGNIVDSARAIGGGDYNKGITMLFWLFISTVAATGMRAGINSLKNLLTGDDKEYDIGNRLKMEMFSQIPILGGTIVSWVNGYPSSVPVPVIDVVTAIPKNLGTLYNSKRPDSKLRAAIRSAGVIGQLAGVPGSTELSSTAVKMVKKSKRGRTIKMKKRKQRRF